VRCASSCCHIFGRPRLRPVMLLPATEWTRRVGVPIMAKWLPGQEFRSPHPVWAYAPIKQPGSGQRECALHREQKSGLRISRAAYTS
jgi:hypothetical protein